MSDLGPKSSPLNVRREGNARRLSVLTLSWALLLLFLFMVVAGNALAADAPNSSRASAIAPSFAIADFDGDHLPDIANVRAGQNGHETSSYWIELHLSASSSEAVRVLAPGGGLSIEARDVNGDRAIDLVLSTARLRKPVAILLNDGHGRFSRIEPLEFPDAFVASNASWNLSCTQLMEPVCVSSQPRSSISREATNAPKVHVPSDSFAVHYVEFLLDPSLISQAERAPPEAF